MGATILGILAGSGKHGGLRRLEAGEKTDVSEADVSEAIDSLERARAGAVPPLRPQPALQPDARGSRRREPFWRVPDTVKAAVWQRDDHTCRYCGFRSLRYQEVLVGGGNARDPDQMATVCLFCHQCLHLDEAAAMRSGVLVWLPEVPQTELHWMVRELYLALITQRAGERARRVLDALLARREPARQRLGSDHPAQLAQRMRGSGGTVDDAVLAGLRLLPLDRRIVRVDELEFNQFPQVLAYWRSPSGPLAAAPGARAEFSWLWRLEGILLPDAPGEASAGDEAAPADPQQQSPSHAELAARLLGDAATFFRKVGEQNPALAQQMKTNADVYDQVAALLRSDPMDSLDLPGAAGDGADDSAAQPRGRQTVAALGVRLLEDSASFFESVGMQNAPLAEQMADNARVYRELAARLREDPLGVLELD
jgi:intracellular multiplication protein IcmJ